MPKTKPEPTAPLADPTSDRVVLAFSGGSARNTASPARDLTAADIARLAYVEAARRTLADGIRPDPRQPDQGLAAAIVAKLLASGAYATPNAAPAADATPADAADTTEG